MTFNPGTKAAKNGVPADRDAINHADQLDQLLGAHALTAIYPGTRVLTPNGRTSNWSTTMATNDYSQSFVMSGTTVGRVIIPVLANESGGDLVVSIHPDSAGSPDMTTIMTRCVIPASWITNLATTGSLASSKLASLHYTALTTNDWIIPAGTALSAVVAPRVITSGDYTIQLGGENADVAAGVANVAVCSFDGATTFSLPLSAPNLPRGVSLGSAAATGDSIVFMGGSDASTTAYASVYCASWDSDTGTVGTWSAQVDLPTTLISAGSAASGQTVYLVGGSTSFTVPSVVNTVYYNTVSNGSIQTTWKQATPLPATRQSVRVGVLNGWLVAAGGLDSSTVSRGETWYAKIQSDGSIGEWLTGPTMPFPSYSNNTDLVTVGNNLCAVSGLNDTPDQLTTIQVLPISATTGPADNWQVINDPNLINSYTVIGGFTTFDQGDGAIVATDVVNKKYYVYTMEPVSEVSVPFAVNLTNGNTYHVVMHQRPTAVPLADYLQLDTSVSALSSTFKYRAVGSTGAWSADASKSIPITVYSHVASGRPVHFRQDPVDSTPTAACTLVNDYHELLVGFADSITLPNDPLNSNTLTTSSVSPWTATNATITASSAQTHGGYSFSGLLTPTGGFTLAYTSSELISVRAGQWYQAQAWLYSTTGWTDVSLSVNWYNKASTYISTSSNSVSLTAATWTQQINNFKAPTAAAFAALVPTEGSTPAAGDTLFISYATLTTTDPTTLSSVTQVTYGTSSWPPTGITQLN